MYNTKKHKEARQTIKENAQPMRVLGQKPVFIPPVAQGKKVRK